MTGTDTKPYPSYPPLFRGGKYRGGQTLTTLFFVFLEFMLILVYSYVPPYFSGGIPLYCIKNLAISLKIGPAEPSAHWVVLGWSTLTKTTN